MRISRVQLHNFRNFHDIDIPLSTNVVIVGENKIGKSNFLQALRLVLDPSLPDASRKLRDEDFWDGIPRPLSRDARIVISVDLTDYEDNDDLLAVLSEHLISTDPMVSRLTFVYGVAPSAPEGPLNESHYEFISYGGDRPENRIGWELRRWIPMDVLAALRDAEGDLANWRRSPLRPLLDEATGAIARPTLIKLAEAITKATSAATKTTEIRSLADRIAARLQQMVGPDNAVDTTLGFSPSDPDRLFRSLRMFIDGGKRGIAEASLGSANLLYITLKALELEHLVARGERHHTFLAIEEPEAHLHPHLQRLVYRDFLRPRAHQESKDSVKEADSSTTILLTTHSTYVASVSPIDSFVVLRKSVDRESTEAASTARIEFTEKERADLERYLDVTRGEMLFARGVILVEGDAEMFLVPALARLEGFDLDSLGISVCSVSGTNFTPYVKFLGDNGLDIPFAVLTDADPFEGGSLGEGRASALLKVMDEPYIGKDVTKLREAAAENGIFLNDYTLEVDLFKCGRHKDMCETFLELTSVAVAKVRAKGWMDRPNTLDVDRFLKDIIPIGKGRFAQRLATNLKAGPCPKYIKDALEYVATSCR